MIIIGNGLIAQNIRDMGAEKLSKVTNTIFFASGVSNSQETRISEFQREIDLLLDVAQAEKQLIYYSTCSISDPSVADTPYVRHKKKIEQILKERTNTLIFRLPQVVGAKGNKNTLVSRFYQSILNGMELEIWSMATRSLIDIDDVCDLSVKLAEKLYGTNEVLNVCAPATIEVVKIAELIGIFTMNKVKYNLIKKGAAYKVDTTRAAELIENYHQIFDDDYFSRILKKYCENTTAYRD